MIQSWNDSHSLAMVVTNSKYKGTQKEREKHFYFFPQVYVGDVGFSENNPCLYVAPGHPFLGPGGVVLPGQHSLGHLRLGLLIK